MEISLCNKCFCMTKTISNKCGKCGFSKMKILWLYKYDSNYNFDHWFHMDLVKAIRKEGHECWAYGPQIQHGYPDECLIAYNPSNTMQDLWNKFQYDVAIIVTQARMFGYYRPALVRPIQPERKEDCWLPVDFKYWQGQKVVLEEDYHYEDNNSFYEEMGIELVLQRHYKNVERFKKNDKKGIKCFWLPFSVDENTFVPDKIERERKFCLVGSCVDHVYPLRRKIINILEPLGLVDHPGRKIDEEYIRCLQSYIGHICCSSIYHITPAKMFEIMASGSVLLTENTDEYGLEHLFPKNSYLTYEKDCNDIIDKTQMIIKNESFRNEITKIGRQCILEKHTHKIRIKEMVDIIERELS